MDEVIKCSKDSFSEEEDKFNNAMSILLCCIALGFLAFGIYSNDLSRRSRQYARGMFIFLAYETTLITLLFFQVFHGMYLHANREISRRVYKKGEVVPPQVSNETLTREENSWLY